MPVQIAGIILFAYASFDRMLGYGLKYEKGFKFTHLGEIGPSKNKSYKGLLFRLCYGQYISGFPES